MNKINIATGNSRLQRVWSNKELTWEEFLDRIRETVRTKETLAEYMKLPKATQDEIKDVGGFVGGYLKNGLRTQTVSRRLVTLDLDFATYDVWSTNIMKVYGDYVMALYSTHKHKKSTPRYRLIIPLDRDVTPEEYEAIARKIASHIGMDLFDDTTYQPQRIMYWPSTSSDGEYVFEVNDDILLDYLKADSVLAEYKDWHDITLWPYSSRANRVMEKHVGKQQDPTTKEGLIGAFCRTYSITEAIEKFIPDYVPSDIENRYTYSKGSTSGGVVIYEDKWSYSHHDTDPASGVLCNSYDLVRLHKFGELDQEAKEGTPANKMPSVLAMTDFVREDSKTKSLILKEQYESVNNDFSVEEDTKETEDSDTSFLEKLEVSKNGQVVASYENIETILNEDPQFKGKLKFNAFNRMIEVKRPFLATTNDTRKGWDVVRDMDDCLIRSYMDRTYHIRGKDLIYDCVNKVAIAHTYHPIKDYLESLKWDGVERLDTMLIDWLGAEDNVYVREVTRLTMLAAVTRIYEPGCKFDNVLTLKGDQSVGKSTLCAKLGMKWFNCSITNFNSKDTFEALQGSWIVELSELTAMKKSEVEIIKSFLSKGVDTFRVAYGRRTESFPRQCIFIGTTNEADFLRDRTGNRRFWIVNSPKGAKGKKHPMEMTQKDVDQLWAEAYMTYFLDRPKLVLSEESLEFSKELQEEFMEIDPREESVREYLDTKLPANWDELDRLERRDYFIKGDFSSGVKVRDKVCGKEIYWELYGMGEKEYTNYDVNSLYKLISSFKEWGNTKVRKVSHAYGRQRYLIRL